MTPDFVTLTPEVAKLLEMHPEISKELAQHPEELSRLTDAANDTLKSNPGSYPNDRQYNILWKTNSRGIPRSRRGRL
jgi:hypothetical protein